MVLLLSLFISAAMAQIKPAEGLWGTNDDPAIGSGLMMTTQNGITVISVFTYDETGQNTWYIASGRVDEENVFSAELIQSENGQNLLFENPQSATFVEQRTNITIQFQGSQLATMQIGEAEPKFIKPNHYGYAVNFDFPDLTGKWLLANKITKSSLVLDLTLDFEGTLGSQTQYYYSSVQQDGDNSWIFNCLVDISRPEFGSCFVITENEQTSEYSVLFSNLGNQGFKLVNNNSDNSSYQAFRLNQDSRLLPNDGLWRPADDPAVGSGMAIRTQGDFTVVLLYSYDEAGRAVWQNAAGQFDENGKLVADLYTPNNGAALESTSPSSAEFEGEPQTLEIQLEGTELATFSISGSEPKYIQNVNFGVELDTTDHFKINDIPYSYPDQTGTWVLVNADYSESRMKLLNPFDLNAFQSPPDPRLYDARQYEDVFDDEDSGLTFFCIKNLAIGNNVFQLRPYCYGRHFIRPNSNPLKIYYQDIGFNEFRYYVGDYINEDAYGEIDRSSPMFYMYRLN